MKLKLNLTKVKPIVEQALTEDLGRYGDITTKSVVDKNYNINTRLVSRQKGVLAGIDVAGLVFKSVSRKISFKPCLKDGSSIRPGQTVANISGSAADILSAERTALNFLSRLSGIATLTHAFVRKTKPHQVKILDTRKTTPNLRIMEKYAVLCGGGYNHRIGLYDQILIKDNHIEAFRDNNKLPRREKISRSRAISLILKNIKEQKRPGIKIEIEVETIRELQLALLEKPDIIMLDNMSLKQIKRCVDLRNASYPDPVKKRPRLEISGGVTLSKIAKLAACGVDMISVGALTHSAKIIDFGLDM